MHGLASKLGVIVSNLHSLIKKVDNSHVIETSKTADFITSTQLQRLDRIFECFKVSLIFTTLTNFSTKYRVMCKVYTDFGGIKQLYHGLPACRTGDNPRALANGLSPVQADKLWYNYYILSKEKQIFAWQVAINTFYTVFKSDWTIYISYIIAFVVTFSKDRTLIRKNESNILSVNHSVLIIT